MILYHFMARQWAPLVWTILISLAVVANNAIVSASVRCSQQPTDRFIGRWIGNDKLNQGAMLKGLYTMGSTLTISRTPQTFVLMRGTGPSQLSYRLDGSLLDVTWNNRPQKTRLSWNGDELILEVTVSGAVGDRYVLSVDGDRLTMEATSTMAAGRIISTVLYYDRVRPDA